MGTPTPNPAEPDHDDEEPCEYYPHDCEQCVADYGPVHDEFDQADQLINLRREK